MAQRSTVDPVEIEHFSQMAEAWWDPHGKFKPLHAINPLRLTFMRDHICQHFNRSTLDAAPFSGLSIVDIGCGGGLLSEPMTRLGADVTGIDASEKNIGIASTHAEQTGLSINYQFTTAEELAAAKKQFDIVVAMEIVEHVADVEHFMEAVAALVKPGGLLFMSTLNRTLKSYALAIVGAEYVLRWLPRGTHQWNKFLRPSELAAQLRVQDLQLIEQCGMVFDPLRQRWSLSSKDLEVNYLLVAQK